MDRDKILNTCKSCQAACCKMCGPDFTEAEMKKVLEAGEANFFNNINEHHQELKTKNGLCPYLKEDNSCSIHELRPAMCRCWPIYPECSKNKKKYFQMECALTPLLSEEEIQELKKEAESIPKELLVSSYNNSALTEEEIKVGLEKFNKFKKRLMLNQKND